MSDYTNEQRAHQSLTNDNAGIVYAVLALAESVDRLASNIPGFSGGLEETKKQNPPARRPSMVTYQGTKIHESDLLYHLYLVAGSEDARESQFARKALYEIAGAGGWDDVCRDCSLHRYAHGSDHFFISEEQ